MREEHERMEISDSALEGVSGGSGDLNTAAARICLSCQPGIDLGYFRCTGNVSELMQYMEEHGANSVRHNIDCPFRKRA